MLPNDSEHRSKERKQVDCQIVVQDTVRDIEVGTIVNLSEDGFMLIGDKLVKENCLYQLLFKLSEELDGKQQLNVGAECLWRNEAGSETQYWSGFHIIDISDDDRASIAHLIN